MKCTCCGDAAAISRGDQYLCHECASRLDWEEIIAIAQEAPVRAA
jgi:hypothetical protein